MTPDVHQQKFLCIQSSQVQVYILVRPGGHWSIHKEAFIILINALMFIEDKANVRTREKVLATSSRAFIYTTTKGCSSVVYLTTWKVGDLQES